LETAATGNETVVEGVFFEGGQINRQTQREKRETEERSKERPETRIEEDPSSRSKEETGSLRDTTSEGPSTL
jgi:hypothetical protein